MKNGAVIKCSEGKDYKTWFDYPDGSKKTIRRNSVEIITSIEDSYKYFSFGDAITLKKEPLEIA
jgi:hypothetical protein